ncbi:MAG TPA: homoserine dehydrogenase, partial [Firmicutes bacterium]|nr:homoserine dehydrogenase [Bacillota bacterium]
GLGTVGSGVVEFLETNRDRIEREVGAPLVLRRILVREAGRARRVAVAPALLTTDFSEVLADPEIQVIVECMGGLEPTGRYLRQAIAAGKQIVTANKELLAKEGRELIRAAEQAGVQLRFEAAVAGGIPIISALKESLAANRISRIMGIVNGTTNYILTAMAEKGTDFPTALAEAQALGYAEADPAADVDGWDAAYKLAILASIAFGSRVAVEDVLVEGIRQVEPADITYAGELGYRIKLLAIGTSEEKGISVRVHPTMIRRDHPLAAVGGVYNAVFVQGNAVGELMFYGRGAGGPATASAVLGDVVNVARHLTETGPHRICSCFYDYPVLPASELHTRYYLRIEVVDQPGVLAKIAGAFGSHGVSLASVIQKGYGRDPVTLVFVTHGVREADLQAAVREIARLNVVYAVKNVLRVEED